MSDHSENSANEKILSILTASPTPLCTRDIGTRMRLSRFRLPDHQLAALLHRLVDDGQVEFDLGRWSVSSANKSVSVQSFGLPALSHETLAILNREIQDMDTGTPQHGISDDIPDAVSSRNSSSRWSTFRKLISYYCRCIRLEEGADAFSFQNQSGKQFTYLRKTGCWYPTDGNRWRSVIPLNPHFASFINSLPVQNEDHALVIGYPVQAYYIQKKDEPDVAIIRPIFFLKVEVGIRLEGLVIRCEDPRPEVNLGWLEYTFARKLDRQRGFLSACGFLNTVKSHDEPSHLEKNEQPPGLQTLVSVLSAFIPNSVREPLKIENIPDHPLDEPFKTGIYNRAVLMMAKRTRYTSTLLKELNEIKRASDEMLNRTALRFIFTDDRDTGTPENIFHEAVVADTGQLNADQRLATASLLTRNITVITGPPGTGKSQTVSSAITNARLRDQTVLFASRNHKAIDAVMGRLTVPDGRHLIVRTNAKDDPTLNYNFTHAIRDILEAPPQPQSSELLFRAKEELLALLDERGRKAALSRQIAESVMELGHIEERKSHIGQLIPSELSDFIDRNPERFPIQAASRVVRTAKAIQIQSDKPSFFKRFFLLFKGCLMMPWYCSARRKLRPIPSLPSLPVFPWFSIFAKLQAGCDVLERAQEFARLRIASLPHETRLKQLPPADVLTAEIAKITQRIEDVALRAIPLDLDNRFNLDASVNRERLDGLRAALNAMRTRLDDGMIRQETERVLEEQVCHILKAFPCWAVTSLSVGSRIPLLAGLFDLAIMDEASQSDIPSAIPILYRSRRAGIVGDPFQLSHASRLTTAKDTFIRRQADLKRIEDMRFAYTESSLYDLFAGTNGVAPIFLSQTYRSTEEIAHYSNRTFYGGRLRVVTAEDRLAKPDGIPTGIHWTEVVGDIRSGGGSGCFCQEEIDTTVRIVRTILLANRFVGTVGVVSPFRQQANRLRDALFESDTELYHALIQSKVHVDTAHGFQGDERDVMIFSLCAGPDMPVGSRNFLRETGNLFNVAVSRARAVLHIVGNREWAKRCGIRHIEALVSPRISVPASSQGGPWHPHESPWEEKLYRTLVAKGLDPRPQFPVSGRRLDLALVGNGAVPVKIDIEVDGDCHRNPDGTRKIDDLWRDIQLQGMGWKVMRFWTYKLREDMDACVASILKVWSAHE